MMSHRRWPVFILLASLSASPARAQLLSDPASLRHTYTDQLSRVQELVSARRDAALDLLSTAREVLALPEESRDERMQLLGEAQHLAQLTESLGQEMETAATMARETGQSLIRLLEGRASSLRQAAGDADPTRRGTLEARAREMEEEAEVIRTRTGEAELDDPLEEAGQTLSALGRIVAEEYERLGTLQALREELRLFLGSLRLFDETGMPPAARSGEGGSHDPGCAPTACAIPGTSPADVPLAHIEVGGPGGSEETMAITPASLATLHSQIATHVRVPDLRARRETRDNGVVTREAGIGMGFLGFRGDEEGSSAPWPMARTALVLSWPFTESLFLTVEPSVGGRALRDGSAFRTELAGELRETLVSGPVDGRSQWQVSSWQKGRYLSGSLSPPGYLEPGRAEAGLVGRMVLPLSSLWQLEAEGGGEGVRYEPDDWRVLDRQGLNAALGVARQGTSHSIRLSMRGSHHGFPHPFVEGDARRRDTRIGVEVGGSIEGERILKLSLGGSWNESRLPAYDYRSVRAALVVSVPWGRGSLQGYAALAHQKYLNPGPEDARVAPSDQDSGSILSLQYALPLDGTRMLMVRGGWSRSQTGFRDDFYERFGISAHLTFRGR